MFRFCIAWLLVASLCFAQEKACVKVGTTTGNTTSSGSGTIIAHLDGKSWIITCKHVIKAGDPNLFVICNGERHKASFEDSHPLCDLTIISVAERIGEPTKVALTKEDEAAVGDEVYHFGCTSGPGKGKVLGWTQFVGQYSNNIDTSIHFQEGDSGSGLFKNGKLVGVNWGGKTNGGTGMSVPMLPFWQLNIQINKKYGFKERSKTDERIAPTPAETPAETTQPVSPGEAKPVRISLGESKPLKIAKPEKVTPKAPIPDAPIVPKTVAPKLMPITQQPYCPPNQQT